MAPISVCVGDRARETCSAVSWTRPQKDGSSQSARSLARLARKRLRSCDGDINAVSCERRRKKRGERLRRRTESCSWRSGPTKFFPPSSFLAHNCFHQSVDLSDACSLPAHSLRSSMLTHNKLQARLNVFLCYCHYLSKV